MTYHPWKQPRRRRKGAHRKRIVTPGMSHRQSAVSHAKDRAWKRMGLALTDQDVEEVAELVRPRADQFLAESDNGRRLYLVHYRQREIHVVYCPFMDCIVTFLPSAAYFKPRDTCQN